MDVITYPCWDQSWSMLVKGTPGDLLCDHPHYYDGTGYFHHWKIWACQYWWWNPSGLPSYHFNTYLFSPTVCGMFLCTVSQLLTLRVIPDKVWILIFIGCTFTAMTCIYVYTHGHLGDSVTFCARWLAWLEYNLIWITLDMTKCQRKRWWWHLYRLRAYCPDVYMQTYIKTDIPCEKKLGMD